MPPLSQAFAVTSYVLRQRLRGVKRYPLVLMLEPLFRCNLACAGCGKIQFPAEILRRHLTPEQCWAAAEECGAPIVSIPGGEPLLHPQIDQVVAGIVAQKRFVYLCTNALKLEESLPKFKPSKYLAFSVHMDGPPRSMIWPFAARAPTRLHCEPFARPWTAAFASPQTQRSSAAPIPSGCAPSSTR